MRAARLRSRTQQPLYRCQTEAACNKESMAGWPNGKASDYESGDCGFEPHVGHYLLPSLRGVLFLLPRAVGRREGRASEGGFASPAGSGASGRCARPWEPFVPALGELARGAHPVLFLSDLQCPGSSLRLISSETKRGHPRAGGIRPDWRSLARHRKHCDGSVSSSEFSGPPPSSRAATLASQAPRGLVLATRRALKGEPVARAGRWRRGRRTERLQC